MASGKKTHFMPTNFMRLRRDGGAAGGRGLSGEGSGSGSKDSSDSVFADLVKAAAVDGRGRGAGRGRGGRGPGRPGSAQVTVFGGGGGQESALRRSREPAAPGVWGGTKAEPAAAAAGGSEDEDGAPTAWTAARYHPTTLPLAPELVAGVGADEGVAEDSPRALAAELAWLRSADANDGRLVLLQLPPVLPLLVSGAEGAAGPRPAALRDLGCSLVGKAQVMESGAVRLRIGDTLLDLAPGTPCVHAQEVVVLSPAAKQAVALGAVTQRLCAVPDLDTLCSDGPLPEYERAEAALEANGMEVDLATVAAPAVEKKQDLELEEASSPGSARRSQRQRKTVVLDDDDDSDQ